MKTCKTFKLIPREEVKRVFEESDTICAECDYTFLCFEKVYEEVSNHCNSNTTIIDFGCSYNAQCYWFVDCKKVISIDLPFHNNVKFKTDNCDIYLMSGQEFIKSVLPNLDIDYENVIAICSYVPDEQLQQMVSKSFKYNYVRYCGSIISKNLPSKE